MNKLQKALPDLRYTVQKEYCGQPSVVYVARFCGDWIGFDNSQSGAIAIAHTHDKNRQAMLEPA